MTRRRLAFGSDMRPPSVRGRGYSLEQARCNRGGVLTAIFWINLDSRRDRRAFMEAQFAALGLTAERIAAVSPTTLDEDMRAKGPTLAVSELCVTASHRAAWRRMVEARISHALILEDDAHLSRALPAFLTDAPSALEGLDLIRIETGRRKVRIGPVTHRLNSGVELRRAHSDQWGTAGYAIALDGARRMLDEPRLFEAPLDHVFFNPRGAAFTALNWRQCAPGLCIQGEQIASTEPLWQSDVTSGRRQRRSDDPRRKQRKTWRRKLAREAARLARQGRALAQEAGDFFAHGARWSTIRYLA